MDENHLVGRLVNQHYNKTPRFRVPMARIVSLEDMDGKLRHALGSMLRPTDSAVVLPQAHRSVESGAFKNIVMRINGVEPNLTPEVFSSNWFAGVSAVKIPNDKAEAILSAKNRATLMDNLKTAIPSEMTSSDVQVGPGIEGDECDRDKEVWVAGFDSPGCCVGVYSASQSRSPDSAHTGMSRLHRDYYLVCKAGGGVAAQVFHARLSAALKKGATLEECFSDSGEPGAQALRRVSAAAKRNRSRIIALAAETLGILNLETIGDSSNPPGKPYRLPVSQFDVSYNSIVLDETTSTPVYQYSAGCVDAKVSHGLITSSNVAEGFVAFAAADGESTIRLRNSAHNCIPFSTTRMFTNRDIITSIAKTHKEAIKNQVVAHPDKDFISARFAWNAKNYGYDLEPPPLWGSHSGETFVSEWSREIGVSRASVIRMQPELVIISGTDPGKLRVAAKAVLNG